MGQYKLLLRCCLGPLTLFLTLNVVSEQPLDVDTFCFKSIQFLFFLEQLIRKYFTNSAVFCAFLSCLSPRIMLMYVKSVIFHKPQSLIAALKEINQALYFDLNAKPCHKDADRVGLAAVCRQPAQC